MIRLPHLALTLSFLLVTASAQGAEAPRVVASIKPVHSLVTAVMAGVGEPELLVKGAGSPHSYALRPSEARTLSRARVVFRISPGMEAFLVRPLESLSDNAMVVNLAEAPGIGLLPAREGGVWGEHEDHDHDEHGHGEHGQEEHEERVDLHLWLDPVNAMVMTNAIAAALSVNDPANARAYLANAKASIARLKALHDRLAARLAPVTTRPYLVYHDAYQYLEGRYRLRAMGSVTATAGHGVGAARLSAMRRLVTEHGAVCIFAEPQFQPKLVEVLADGTNARRGVLDPLGADIPPGPGHYPALMERLADSLADCLSG